MIPELCVYGLASGLLIKRINTRHIYVDLYLALIPAMLLGRMIGGVARAIFYFATSQTYSLMLWASAYFFKSIPGIILHLMVIPTLVVILMKVRLIPMRYSPQ